MFLFIPSVSMDSVGASLSNLHFIPTEIHEFMAMEKNEYTDKLNNK